MRDITEKIIGGRKCFICAVGEGGFSVAPVVYMGVSERETGSIVNIIDGLKKRTDKAFIINAFESRDWNADFSPWEAPPVFGNEPFAGHAAHTLSWLRQYGVLQTEAEYAGAENFRKRIIAGYSLAGLFSLWAYYETYEQNLFYAAVSCSGSLWYPGFKEYFDSQVESRVRRSQPGYIYLSLGDQEARTRNRQMSQVEAITRYVDEKLEEDPGVLGHIFELNPGGHFADNGIRMAKGIAWALEQEML